MVNNSFYHHNKLMILSFCLDCDLLFSCAFYDEDYFI